MNLSNSTHPSALGIPRVPAACPLHPRVARVVRGVTAVAWTACAAMVLHAQSAAPAGAPGPRQRLVVAPAWLAAHIGDRDLVILDVGEESEYLAGHVPGARHVDVSMISANADMASHNASQLMLEMLPADQLHVRLAALGITDRSRVVVYANKDWVTVATRVLFTLAYAGLGDQSVLLDGGLAAWRRAGQPVSTAAPPPLAPSAPLSATAQPELIVDAAWVRKHLDAPGVRIVDARARVYYDGTEKGESRKGHVHGAASIPFSSVFDDNLRLRPAAELTALFQAAGIAPGDTVVGYCHIGQQATGMLLAAASLGHPVRLYDGSFEDWSHRPDLPVDDPSATARK